MASEGRKGPLIPEIFTTDIYFFPNYRSKYPLCVFSEAKQGCRTGATALSYWNNNSYAYWNNNHYAYWFNNSPYLTE